MLKGCPDQCDETKACDKHTVVGCIPYYRGGGGGGGGGSGEIITPECARG